MAVRHDDDAGGDSEILKMKSALRTAMWKLMDEKEISRFPGAFNKIPNFEGAERAASRLRKTPEWMKCNVLKVNPDTPQKYIRQAALEDDKVLYMPIPKLSQIPPFVTLSKTALHLKGVTDLQKASELKHGLSVATHVSLEEIQSLDIIVMGSVAVTPDGKRIGKGGGYADLEAALAFESRLIDPKKTLFITTVHDCQVLCNDNPVGGFNDIPVDEHDSYLDIIVTPTRVIYCPSRNTKENLSIKWNQLTDDKINKIPLLGYLRQELDKKNLPSREGNVKNKKRKNRLQD